MPAPLLFSSPIYLEHKTGQHPECPARLESVTARLKDRPILKQFVPKESLPAERPQLERVHSAEHVKAVEWAAQRGGGRVESDTVMSPRSYEVAVRAAGAGVTAVDAVLNGVADQALCLIRPPGHHALRDTIMGFCLFNNVAVAAAHALELHGLNRVLIVDFDVHHGNGTQDIFYDTDRVFFLSVHRFPFYPGTGAAHETGTGKGLGATFNLPLAMGVKRKDYVAQFETILEQAATRCKPDLILLSAGFDAHARDPIGSLGLETEDFGPLTALVGAAAKQHCGGKLVSLLEGGYNLDALAESVECHMETLVKMK